MSRIWRRFRSWPLWGQILSGLVVLAVLGAVFGGNDDVSDVEEQTTATSAGAAEKEAGGETVELSCESFSKQTAEELISNSDTGERKVEGPIIATAAVKSAATVSGNDLWFISINVGGTIVTLGHDVPPGEDVEGSGLYYSLNPASEAATSFPTDPRGEVTESTDGFQESVACVES